MPCRAVQVGTSDRKQRLRHTELNSNGRTDRDNSHSGIGTKISTGVCNSH